MRAKRDSGQCLQYMTAIHRSLQGLHQEMGVSESGLSPERLRNLTDAPKVIVSQ
jgi:hypothetical protein